jgi:hypothetical protein
MAIREIIATRAYDIATITRAIELKVRDFHAFFIFVSSQSAVKSSYAI